MPTKLWYGAGMALALWACRGEVIGAGIEPPPPPPPPPSQLTRLTISPSPVTVATGDQRQFSVSGRLSDGSTVTPQVTWSATGGAITQGGLYTAGSVTGQFHVITLQVGGSLADTSLVTITTPIPAGPPNILAKDFEDGAWSPLDNVAGSPASPPWSLVNDASSANGGTWSARYEVGGANTYAPGLYRLPSSYDEIYWRVDLKFTTAITGQLKFLRVGLAGSDGGGLYWQGAPRGNAVSSGLGFSFGPEASNVQLALGIWTGLRNPGFETSGYRTLLENLAVLPGYHRLLIHYQRNGSATPRARFWIDGIPVVQPTGPAYAMDGYVWGSSQGGADWVGGTPGVTPSWLTAGSRQSSARINELRYADQMSGNNTTSGFIFFDNFWVSSTPLQP